MIKNVRHTGLVVRDIDRALEFYSALGFTLWNRDTEKGSFIEQVTGIPDVRLEWAKLKGHDGFLLELLQYHSHPQQAPCEPAPSNQLGCSHLSFTVIDIEAVCHRVVQLGGTVVNKPATSPSGKVRVAYCHDLDGILIELVEEI